MGITIFDSTPVQFRHQESAGQGSGLIDIHVIRPGWGSSGYYSEQVLREACQNGVYKIGTHMHLDHPSTKEENDQPARTLKTLIGALTEAGHYEINGWDGPGVYAQAQILPQYREEIKEMQSYIGVSHYVNGVGENGTAPDGKRGRIISKLIPDPLNTIDLVTVPGAGGKFRALFESVTTRIRDSMADAVPDLMRAREAYRDELVSGGMPKDRADRLAEIDVLVPESPEFIKAREDLRDSYVANGMTIEQASRLAGINE